MGTPVPIRGERRQSLLHEGRLRRPLVAQREHEAADGVTQGPPALRRSDELGPRLSSAAAVNTTSRPTAGTGSTFRKAMPRRSGGFPGLPRGASVDQRGALFTKFPYHETGHPTAGRPTGLGRNVCPVDAGERQGEVVVPQRRPRGGKVVGHGDRTLHAAPPAASSTVTRRIGFGRRLSISSTGPEAVARSFPCSSVAVTSQASSPAPTAGPTGSVGGSGPSGQGATGTPSTRAMPPRTAIPAIRRYLRPRGARPEPTSWRTSSVLLRTR